jgi:transposase-like protein
VAAEAVPEAFGLSRSSVSRRYIRATARKLQALQERRLDQYDLVALLLDGKMFADDTMVVALGITLRGEKVLLGFVQTGTENATTCAAFLRSLLDRRLRIAEGLLVVLDGSKGLRRAVHDVFGAQARVQRCTWHKRENVVAYVPKHLHAVWRGKLQQAYRQSTHAGARAALDRLHGELRRINEDAARSLAEGVEETLTLHRLGLADRLGVSLLTTNGLESIMALVEQRVGKVDRWTTSDQKQRWLATVLLEIEPRLRRLQGYRALPQLRVALQQTFKQETEARVA